MTIKILATVIKMVILNDDIRGINENDDNDNYNDNQKLMIITVIMPRQ